MSKVNLLRAITNRLNHTPVDELPHVASFLGCSIQSCADVLQSISDQVVGKKDDSTIQIHKLRARLSSLLQDRSTEGRFTAIVLIKATVEAGGRDVLASCEPWLRGLLAILNRQDPVSSKKLCLLTITRIFSLTRQYPTLMREITTPLLPAFLTACTTLAGLHQPQAHQVQAIRQRPCLETVLQCLLHLLPHHPSTFRPFVPKIHAGLANLIVGQSGSHRVTELARSVFVTLPSCAPKSTAETVWLNVVKTIVSSAHDITSQVFRAIIEDWEAPTAEQRQPSARTPTSEPPQGAGGGQLGLPSWQGMYQGSRLLIGLLSLLRTFLYSPTAQLVDIPLGLILDLTSRLVYVPVPATEKDAVSSVRFNLEIERGEREELWVILPEIHQSTLYLLSDVVKTLELNIIPIGHAVLDQCSGAFEAGKLNQKVRRATYDLLQNLLPVVGPHLTKDSFKPLAMIVASCCEDAGLSGREDTTVQGCLGSHVPNAKDGHADSFLENASKKSLSSETPPSRIEIPAARLMYQVLKYVPATSLPHLVRSKIDRTAILSNLEYIMLASVLNPTPRTGGKHAAPSLMPFLARASSDQLATENLLRPRMPVTVRHDTATVTADDVEEEREQIDVDVEDPKSRQPQRRTAPLQSLAEQSTGRMDLLDKLEDSIGDGSSLTPRTAPFQENGVSHIDVAPSLGEDSVVENGSPQRVKRHFHKTDSCDLEASAKRIRASEDRIEQMIEAPLEVDPLVNNTPTAGLKSDVPDAAASADAIASTGFVGNGKAPATDPSLQPIGPTTSQNGKINDGAEPDDESDFEMPPLYLKTSSEEDSEEDGDID